MSDARDPLHEGWRALRDKVFTTIDEFVMRLGWLKFNEESGRAEFDRFPVELQLQAAEEALAPVVHPVQDATVTSEFVPMADTVLLSGVPAVGISSVPSSPESTVSDMVPITSVLTLSHPVQHFQKKTVPKRKQAKSAQAQRAWWTWLTNIFDEQNYVEYEAKDLINRWKRLKTEWNSIGAAQCATGNDDEVIYPSHWEVMNTNFQVKHFSTNRLLFLTMNVEQIWAVT
jgi:hypothetical protein